MVCGTKLAGHFSPATRVRPRFSRQDDTARAVRAISTGLAQALARLDETRALAGLSTYSLMPTVGIGVDGDAGRFGADR